MLKRIFRYFKIRRIVKKVNKALKIKLHKWQIKFIFDGKPYSDEIKKERRNGKTLAHILRICLEESNVKLSIFQRKGRKYGEPYFYISNRDTIFLERFADDDCKLTRKRMECFVHDLKHTYELLSSDKTTKGELRDIRFFHCREGVRMI